MAAIRYYHNPSRYRDMARRAERVIGVCAWCGADVRDRDLSGGAERDRLNADKVYCSQCNADRHLADFDRLRQLDALMAENR